MSRVTPVIILLLLCGCVALILLVVPSPKSEAPFSRIYSAMGTYCQIVIPSSGHMDPSLRAESALAEIRNIEALASTYRPDSEISLLSNLPPNLPRPLSSHIYTVLDRSIYYSKLTDGAFDVTVGPLMNLWRVAATNDLLPTPAEIADVLQAVGYGKIILDPAKQTIKLNHDGMAITLDAIVKGYAADIALQNLRKDGLSAALVDLGGDIVCFGQPPGRQGWNIGVQNPFKPATAPMNTSEGNFLTVISLTNAAVATSGNYQRVFSIQGKKYSQIVDPRSGLHVEQAPSVTVIAPTAADADALATACSVLTVPEALKLIDRIPHTEALLITGSPEAPRFHTSSGFAEYLLEPLPDFRSPEQSP